MDARLGVVLYIVALYALEVSDMMTIMPVKGREGAAQTAIRLSSRRVLTR